MNEWAPIAGSSVVAVATLITLYFTVRENRKALTEASRQHRESLDDITAREWRQWKREKITEYCEEILDTGQAVIGSLRGSVYWSTKDFLGNFVEQTNNVSGISNVARKLELVVDDALDNQLKKIHNSIAEILEKTKEELDRKQYPHYNSSAGLERLEPSCAAATEALRALTSQARSVMGKPPNYEDSPPSDLPLDSADSERLQGD
jgi:hypothetical protein